MNIIIMAAIGLNNELGFNNGLIWKLKGDMKFFREQTTGHTIVMGRKMFESLPKLLPNRRHIVITSQNKVLPSEVQTFSNVTDVIKHIRTLNEDVYIIGGESIYRAFLEYSNILYLTKINATSKADTYFPKFNKNDYITEIIQEEEENGISYKFVKYTKRGAK